MGMGGKKTGEKYSSGGASRGGRGRRRGRGWRVRRRRRGPAPEGVKKAPQ
ncbi:Protein of unknown function, partial [Gryllus bimaculatus]